MVEKRGMDEADQGADGWEVIREESGGSGHPEGSWHITANGE